MVMLQFITNKKEPRGSFLLGGICPFLHMTEGDIIRGKNVGYGDRYIRCMQKWKKEKLKENRIWVYQVRDE